MFKILMLNYEFPPLGGGAGNALYYMLKEFSRVSNVRIDLVASSSDKFRIEKFSDNITIHFLEIGKNGKNPHYQTCRDIINYSRKAYLYAKHLMKNIDFGVCHAFFTVPCGYIAMKLKLPYIVSLRGSDVPFYNKRFYLLDKFIFKRLARKIWSNAHAVISNSEGLKQLALNTSPGQGISIICNGVDTDEFKPAEFKKKSSILRLISVGRLTYRKGYDFLIKAISGNKKVELVLIGEGNREKRLRALAVNCGSNAVFMGRKPHDQVREFLQESDVFVLPSINEGMSNAILEAMACGLPIISTDIGGSKELVQGNGFIVQKYSVSELEKAIACYVGKPHFIVKHGARSRKLACSMSWGNAVNDYIKIYENI
jgi:L-malate glycosyltransferase